MCVQGVQEGGGRLYVCEYVGGSACVGVCLSMGGCVVCPGRQEAI